jgi:hypothetical protein
MQIHAITVTWRDPLGRLSEGVAHWQVHHNPEEERDDGNLFGP